MKNYNLPTIDSQIETIILANGQFPIHEIPVSILHNAKFIVCCDGAIDELSKINLSPSAIVGDCDSMNAENKERYKKILHKNPDQETNDLTKAVNFCIKNGRKDIAILGATGKREDHTLGNISLLTEYMDIANVKMITDYGIFIPIKTNSEFESHEGQQVSMFVIEQTLITTQGLKYPVENRLFSNWWQGTLNESLSNKFSIETNNKIIVYRAF